jgi:hypothetical protein
MCQAFSRDQALPQAVRGPVDFLALWRLPAENAGVKVGDVSSDMAVPAYYCTMSIWRPGTIVK